MPCDSITTQSVNLANAIPTLVDAALRTLGWNVSGTLDNKSKIIARSGSYVLEWTKGEGVQITGMSKNETAITALTKEYSRAAVSWAAQRAGWQVKSTGANTLEVSRR